VKRDVGPLLSALTGLFVFLSLHLFFRWTWDRLFASAPWPGYEESARLGLVEPWFVNSPRSLWITRTVLFAVACGSAFWRRSGRWPNAALLWAGAAAAAIAVYATTTMPSLPAGALGYVIYPFRLLLPVVLGTALGELAARAVRSRRATEAAGRGLES
jgi:hypothetical protein